MSSNPTRRLGNGLGGLYKSSVRCTVDNLEFGIGFVFVNRVLELSRQECLVLGPDQK